MIQTFEKICVKTEEKDILRQLGEKIAKIGSMNVQKETAELWKKVNSLSPCRPAVWIAPHQIPWNEIGIEKKLQCSSGFCRQLELNFLKILYQWENFPCDMVVDNFISCPLQIKAGDFGLSEDSEKIHHDSPDSIASHKYTRLIKDEKDIDKIRTPEVEYDAEATEYYFELYQDIFKDVLAVKKQGQPGFWFAPWDSLTTWYGAQEILMDMAFRPELLKMAMEKLTEANLEMLEKYEKQNLLSLNNGNYKFGNGTGGPGYTDELPKDDFDGENVRTCDLWGSAAAQIFSEVSPQMHEELALKYEKRWLEKFGLNYYGCCEPLHNKIDILENIPNLRKISMSPWAKVEKGAEKIGRKYVYSYKADPAVFAEDHWDQQSVSKKIQKDIETIQGYGCVMEIILKDVSTINKKPKRLNSWAQTVSDLAARY